MKKPTYLKKINYFFYRGEESRLMRLQRTKTPVEKVIVYELHDDGSRSVVTERHPWTLADVPNSVRSFEKRHPGYWDNHTYEVYTEHYIFTPQNMRALRNGIHLEFIDAKTR